VEYMDKNKKTNKISESFGRRIEIKVI